MRTTSRRLRLLGLGVLAVVVASVVAARWAVPAVIVAAIRSSYDGRVRIDGYWVNRTSAGVRGLSLHETDDGSSPVWLRAESVRTDLTLGGLLRGRFEPHRLSIRSPSITIRLDRAGRPITQPKFKPKPPGAPASPPPAIVATGASLAFAREGWPAPMVVRGIDARARPGATAVALSAGTNDPDWGPWTVFGACRPDFAAGSITIRGQDVRNASRKLDKVPFVPPDVGQNVRTNGPVDVDVTLRWDVPTPPVVLTRIGLNRADVSLPTVGITSAATTGRVVVDGASARFEGIEGESLGGRIAADGAFRFGEVPPALDVRMRLANIEVSRAPKSWQLDEAGIDGRLTGSARLRARLDPGGVDLAGSTGEAEIRGAMLSGIDVKSIHLAMTANGRDLRYTPTTPAAAATAPAVLPRSKGEPFAIPPKATEVARETAIEAGTPRPARGGGLSLPDSISTRIEFEDVDLSKILARGAAIGVHVPFPVAGTLSLRADATIPLKNSRRIDAYVFRGDLDLKGASVDGIDLGRLAARFDLSGGVLDVRDLRGRLVDKPEGDNRDRPAVAELPPSTGPLPIGGFRAGLRAELASRGGITLRVEANRLPVGELAAPFFPRPTPVSGVVTLDADVKAPVADLSEAKAWAATTKVDFERVRYRGAELAHLRGSAIVRDGRLQIPDVSAQLAGRDLSARLGVVLAPPYATDAALSVEGWDLSEILTLIPAIPHPSAVDGVVTVHAEATGDLAPMRLRSRGNAMLAALRVGGAAIGDLPLTWETPGDAIVATVAGAHPLGGDLKAEATIPTSGVDAIRGSGSIRNLDLARLAAIVPDPGLGSSGLVAADLTFAANPREGSLDADGSLTAPALTLRGVAVEAVDAAIKARGWSATYAMNARSLGGKMRVEGDWPIGGRAPKTVADAHVRVAAVRIGGLWPALAIEGPLARLDGLAAIDVNLRTPPGPLALHAMGLGEVRDLRLGPDLAIGNVRGQVASSPAQWRVEPISGDLFGGTLTGAAWSGEVEQGPRPINFRVGLDRASIPAMLADRRSLARRVEGHLTINLSGLMEDVLRAEGQATLDRARVSGLPISELRAPVDLTFNPALGVGTVHVRNFAARLAGGQVRGNVQARLGVDRSFSADSNLSAVELEMLSRAFGGGAGGNSGKISGRITATGPDYLDDRKVRGRIDLDLDDASLVEMPVFREIDRFLGASRGGLFEDGDLHGSVADRRLIVDELTLAGRLAQVHASGTVGADGRLDMAVLVNTSQIIGQSGDALAASIPGFRDRGRGDQAVGLLSNFLSNRLLKLRVGGTLSNPQVTSDPGVLVTAGAATFFGAALKLPMGLVR